MDWVVFVTKLISVASTNLSLPSNMVILLWKLKGGVQCFNWVVYIVWLVLSKKKITKLKHNPIKTK